jgi:hypothetical protein
MAYGAQHAPRRYMSRDAGRAKLAIKPKSGLWPLAAQASALPRVLSIFVVVIIA